MEELSHKIYGNKQEYGPSQETWEKENSAIDLDIIRHVVLLYSMAQSLEICIEEELARTFLLSKGNLPVEYAR